MSRYRGSLANLFIQTRLGTACDQFGSALGSGSGYGGPCGTSETLRIVVHWRTCSSCC